MNTWALTKNVAPILIVIAVLIYSYKPRTMFDDTGNLRTFGLCNDKFGRQQTLFTYPIVLGFITVAIVVVTLQLQKV